MAVTWKRLGGWGVGLLLCSGALQAFMHHPSELQTFVSGDGSVFIHILERAIVSERLIVLHLFSLFTARLGGAAGALELNPASGLSCQSCP